MPQLNDETRSKLSGGFIELSGGFTHYEVAGPADGRPVVLITGLTVPMFVWDGIFERLSRQGLRVLRYDMFGRGYSDRPPLNYDLDTFTAQLEELLTALKIAGRINLVGWSMGAAVAAAHAARNPGKIGRVCFIAPVGFDVNMSIAARLAKSPLGGALVVRLLGRRTLYKNLKGYVYDQSLLPQLRKRFGEQMVYAGFMEALQATLQHFNFDERFYFERFAQQGRPTMLIWGEDDPVTPYGNHAEAVTLFGETGFLSVPRARHAVQYERADVVVPALLKFLKS